MKKLKIKVEMEIEYDDSNAILNGEKVEKDLKKSIEEDGMIQTILENEMASIGHPSPTKSCEGSFNHDALILATDLDEEDEAHAHLDMWVEIPTKVKWKLDIEY